MSVKYGAFSDLGKYLNRKYHEIERPVVCIQGLGFVGFAMGLAVASVRDETGSPSFNVIGVDLPTREGLERINLLNQGTLPFRSNDKKMSVAFDLACKTGNYIATSDPEVFSLASVTLVSINLDIQNIAENSFVDMTGFKKAIRTLGTYMSFGSLIIVETTVPPGTCEKIVVPEVKTCLKERGLPENSILISHSYERVMPGDHYLDSIINFWRVYAGYTEEADEKCRDFLSKVINVREYPLMKLHSMTASETGKVLENSYRAVNIAFIEEWARFAEIVGVDLFEVISAIRKRPTHNNIRQPGFGVGGYCLTKDPLFAKIAARDFFNLKEYQFPFCESAIQINNRMPLVTLGYISKHFNDDIKSKKILLLGVSYRQDVGDSRYSPSMIFVKEAEKLGAEVVVCDPLLDYWSELDREVNRTLPNTTGIDAIVFVVQHKEYRDLDLLSWLKGSDPYIFDANNVISPEKIGLLKAAGYTIKSIGRGNI